MFPREEAARHEFILSDPNTRLGHIARRVFEDASLELKSRNDNITAAFAAAMAREGLGLALTYESCRIESKDALYLSLGEEGIYMDLAIMFPVSSYRSRATLAFASFLQEELKRRLTPMP